MVTRAEYNLIVANLASGKEASYEAMLRLLQSQDYITNIGSNVLDPSGTTMSAMLLSAYNYIYINDYQNDRLSSIMYNNLLKHVQAHPIIEE